MGRVNIKELLLYGERLTLECKAAKNALPNAVWPTYSSFCNTVGGVMLLGIDIITKTKCRRLINQNASP